MTRPTRFLFFDLDALIESAALHVQEQHQSLELNERLETATSINDNIQQLTIDPQKLTALLEDRAATSLIVCRKGTHFQPPYIPMRNAFKDLGWEMQLKQALDDRTLENLLDQTFQETGAYGNHESKTLVLVTDPIEPTVLGLLEFFLHGNW